MSYLIAIAASFALLAGFTLISYVETRTGVRLLGGSRRRLDKSVSRLTFVLAHIDWGAFISHIARVAAERIAHDVVHTTLIVVRATERTLTRLIRILRERVALRAPEGPPVEGSQLIATLVRFRKNLTGKK
jgi:hypothetical protein